MNIRSIEVCTVVTVLAILGFFIHGLNGCIVFLGHANGLVDVLSIIFMVFNIFALSSFRAIAEISGIYHGNKRYLSARRVVTYLLWALSGVGLILYRQYEIESSVAIAGMNLAAAFTIINAFGFGKIRGKFYWCKYI